VSITSALADGASDADLAMAIAGNDERALAEVYRRHAGAVFGLARRLLVERSSAEDVVQEVFLRLWNDPQRYDPARGSLRSYLLAQTHGRSVDAIRSDTARRRREQRDLERSAPGPVDVERQVEDLTMAERLRRSLDALPPAERAAIEMAYWGGYTYREVAARLSEPEGTVKSRIRHGMQRLQRNLDPAGLVSAAT
jgi:RNA polymerase sigma-70 factor (ECF subfamily)